MRHVYLLRLTEQDGVRYKIGSSADPEVRCHNVTAGAGELLHAFPSADAFAVERALHRRFGHCRIVGIGREREWFRLTDEDVAAFRRLGQTDAVADLPADLTPPPPPRFRTVSIDRELVRQMRVILAHDGDTITEYLDSILRPLITADYEAALEAIRREVAARKVAAS